MNNVLKLSEIDCIFLSYDEPNADRNWADLQTKAPWAKRVHGVKGSDAAHKACAKLSQTDRFITVDGDNIVDQNFFNLSLDLTLYDNPSFKQFSWCGKNIINNLEYGNGGLKCWTRDFVLNMKTHEAADSDRGQVDFCWEKNYMQLNDNYSTSYPNASPRQAWRAGFREGVKLSLDNGTKIEITDPRQQLIEQNYQRLLIWQSIGADVKNGLWAIYGARLGFHMTNLTNWNYLQVRDFEYLNSLFDQRYQEFSTEQLLLAEIKSLGDQIRIALNMPIADLDSLASQFFKGIWVNPPRMNREPKAKKKKETKIIIPKMDVIFISNYEPNAENNWSRLLEKAAHAQRVSGVKGILAAHRAAAAKATTDMFYVVDGDAYIVDDFNFDYDPENKDAVHVFNSINPVNGLVYGYGGVKLFPRTLLLNANNAESDVTTSVAENFVTVRTVSNVTEFNTDPFSAWRSAFRECAKLAAGQIKNQVPQETKLRLDTWLTVGKESTFGSYVLAGARAGYEFGSENKLNKLELAKINDYEWLREQYEQYTRLHE